MTFILKDKDSILKNISLSGSASENKGLVSQAINANPLELLDVSTGLPRIKTNLVKKFKLVLSQPLILATLSSFEIRCAFCKIVISYPCWYYDIKYNVNHFHYFVCFDSNSNDKVNTNCRRG